LKVCILWHMHQPDYRDPVSGQTLLPWTYLHAVKDYGEMLRIAEEHPENRLTFNLVPVMLEQLQAYASGQNSDYWLDLARREPADLDEQQRRFMLQHFFSVHGERHIMPHRRYAELAHKANRLGSRAWEEFSDAELGDLQVWFLLAWSGHFLRNEEPIAGLLRKGENYTAVDKRELLNCYDREVASIIDRYRKLESEGLIEISVTPYAHPILPLLCGTAIARVATPGMQLPAASFRHTEDAVLQVRHGLALVNKVLGPRPRGMWPAEGAISEDAIRIMHSEGALWAASDEAILDKSLVGGIKDRKQLYRPYHFAELPLLFRDRELSDRIGFVYAHWPAEKAAADLLRRLHAIAASNPDGMVSLILDGENCWERYEDNGYPFLTAFYRGLARDPALQAVGIKEALAGSDMSPLERLAPGSWINGDFKIWIGHSEENTAWDWLERGRRDIFNSQHPLHDENWQPGTPLPPQTEHLLHAEGSDWFWWYGDDHATDQADMFDRLFRRHLEALYKSGGQTPPNHLQRPIKPPKKPLQVVEPRDWLNPKIDGVINDYFEWLAAGRVDLTASGAMHAHDGTFALLHFGFNDQHLFLRLDPIEDLLGLTGERGALEIHLQTEKNWVCRFTPGQGLAELRLANSHGSSLPCQGAYRRVVELAIPLEPLQLKPGERFGLSVHLLTAKGEQGRWPLEGPARLPFFGTDLAHDDWYV